MAKKGIMYKRMTLNNGVINDYALKSSIFFNDYVLLITGSYTYFIRTEIKPSSISAFLVVISETFFRKTRVWPKNSPPTTTQAGGEKHIEYYQFESSDT
jgi:hypothetical protein